MRTLPAALATNIAAQSGELVHLLELNYIAATATSTTTAVRLASTPVDVSIETVHSGAAVTWSGIGGGMAFEPISETLTPGANGVTVLLAAADPSAVLTTFLTSGYLGQAARIYLAHLSGGAATATAICVFAGRMTGELSVEERRTAGSGAQGAIVRVRLEHRLADLSQVRGIRTSVESHQALFSGDDFFKFVPSLVNRRFSWGRATGGAIGVTPRQPEEQGWYEYKWGRP